MPVSTRVLVLGVGNILMGDEGVGIHAVRQLDTRSLPADTAVVDGGTGGFTLLAYFDEYPVIVMIDAAMDGRPPGTVTVIEPRFASDFPRALSAHDIGLRDLIEAAALLGPLPRIYLVAVSVAHIRSMHMELSEEIQSAVPEVIARVHAVLDRIRNEGTGERPVTSDVHRGGLDA